MGSSASSSGEPVLSSNVNNGDTLATIVEPGTESPVIPPTITPTRTVGIVDRHPLLRKPQQYYDNTKSNKLVKTASATFVGVPAGILGELKQIVIGKPSATTY